MHERLSVDVVGCGEIAQIMHLPNLFELSDRFAVRALCDKDQDVLKGVAERHGVDATFTDHRAMIETCPADILVVLTSGDHVGIVNDALDRGMHVFVEKPLCYSAEDAHEIAQSLRAKVDSVVPISRQGPAAAQAMVGKAANPGRKSRIR